MPYLRPSRANEPEPSPTISAANPRQEITDDLNRDRGNEEGKKDPISLVPHWHAGHTDVDELRVQQDSATVRETFDPESLPSWLEMFGIMASPIGFKNNPHMVTMCLESWLIFQNKNFKY